MSYCTQCGFQNDDDANFCNECGRKLEAPITMPQDEPYKRWFLWLVIGFSFVFVFGATIWLVKSADKEVLTESDNVTISKTKRSTQARLPKRSRRETTVSKSRDSVGKIIESIPKTGEDVGKVIESIPKAGEKVGDVIKSIPKTGEDVGKIVKSVPKSKDEISKVVDTVFGADQDVGKLEKKLHGLPPNLSDVENASAYEYSVHNCNDLLTDIPQQMAYSIQNEIAVMTQISAEEENKLGGKLFKEVQKQFKGKLDQDKEWLAYVQSLGQNLASQVERKGIHYHFHVINEDKVNAFAMPGGGICLFTGLLNKIENEAQLAAVITHEIKHVDLRHCIAMFQVLEKLPGVMQNSFSMILANLIKHPYSSRVEADADRRGLEMIYSLGYSPYQVVRFWENLEETPEKNQDNEQAPLFGEVFGKVAREVENVFMSHPNHGKRICLLKNHILKLQQKYPRPIVYVGAWNIKDKTPMFVKQK